MKEQKPFLEKFCPCGCFNAFDSPETDFIKEYKHWFLYLNHEQRFLGRCLLILKAHKVDESELTNEEILEKHKIYCFWREAIDKAFRPDKINQAQLGNEEHIHRGHIHWHFVPRYRRPIYFAGVEFQSDTSETQKLNYALVHKRKVYSPEIRKKIKEELLKYL